MSETSKSSLFERFIPMLLIITVGLAFLVGILWQKVNNLEGGKTNTVANNPAAADPNTAPQVNGKLTDDQVKNVPAISDADHLKGSNNAEVYLVEYSDLECPFCKNFHPTAQKALDEYGDKVAWAYRQFPLETIHPRALPAAIASECVAKAGGSAAFWKYIDMVFADQTTYLTEDGLKSGAVKSGVSAAEFDKCYAAKETEAAIRETIASATTAGVTGTPATFVMNKKGGVWLVAGAVPYESLKVTIDEALQ
jgi:protein-disulfide isomerase